jgi:hypothetical protein
MKFVELRPYADPEAAAQLLLSLADRASFLPFIDCFGLSWVHGHFRIRR